MLPPFPGRRSGCVRGDAGEINTPAALGIGLAIIIVTMLAIRVASVTGVLGSSDQPRALVLGDSITDQGQRELADQLGSQFRLSVDGKASFTAAQQEPSAERWATRDFTQVVVNLGTNDVVSGVPTAETAATLSRIVALYPGASCVHLVTVNASIPPETAPDVQARARDLNRQIKDLAAPGGRVRIVDWATIVERQRVEGNDPTIDGVHPTAEGHELLSEAIAESIDACPVVSTQ